MTRETMVRGGMFVRRIVAAAHVSTGEADPQMNPSASEGKAFLAAARARSHRHQLTDMRARCARGPQLDSGRQIDMLTGSRHRQSSLDEYAVTFAQQRAIIVVLRPATRFSR